MDLSPARPRDTIFNASRSCLELFAEYLSGDRAFSTVIAQKQQLFWMWSNSLKVFAKPHLRLDAQLQNEKYASIRQMVLLLLCVLKRNLLLALSVPIADALRKESIGVEAQGKNSPLRVPLFGINGSLTRLEKIATVILSATQGSLARRVSADVEKDKRRDEYFENHVAAVLDFHFQAAIPPGLKQLIYESCVYRHYRILDERSRQSHKPPVIKSAMEPTMENLSLTARSPVRGVEQSSMSYQQYQYHQDPTKQSPRTEQIQRMKPLGTQSDQHTTTLAVDLSFVNEQITRDSSTEPLPKTLPLVSETEDAIYPRAPVISQGQSDAVCPICLKSLPAEEFESYRWKAHIDNDIMPYVCISGDCSKSLQFFENSKAWSLHMKKNHTVFWIRYLHNDIIWKCPFTHVDDQMSFGSEKRLNGHLLSNHTNMEEAELRHIASISGVPQLRPIDTCPICGDKHLPQKRSEESHESDGAGSDPEDEVPQQRRVQFDFPSNHLGNIQTNHPDQRTKPLHRSPDEERTHNQIEKYIGKHLKALAFHFSNRLVNDQDGLSYGFMETSAPLEFVNAENSIDENPDLGTAPPHPRSTAISRNPSQGPPNASTDERKLEGVDSWVHLCKHLFLNQRFWEIWSALLSLSCMVAVVILGMHLDDSSLSDWTFAIAPSTIISTLITVAKTSMFISVSEGLTQLKWNHFVGTEWPIAELEAFDCASRGTWGSMMFFWKIMPSRLPVLCGSFLLITSLIIDPFAQQIVSVETRGAPRTGANASILVANSYDTDAFTFLDVLDTRMKSAAYSGLLSRSIPFDFTCPSGNCTWPDFFSLALCNSCVNATDIAKPITALRILNVTTPNGLSVELIEQTQYDIHQKVVGGVAKDSSELDSPFLVNLTIAQNKLKMAEHPTNYDLKANWVITECQIELCVKKYQNVRAVNASLQLFDIEKIALQSLTKSDPQKSSLFIPSPVGKWDYGKAPMWPFQNSTFIASKRLSAILRDMLSFSVWLHRTDGYDPAGAVFQYPANVTAVVDNIADSITIAIRTGENPFIASGIIWDQDTHIFINWAWLSFPTALVLLSSAFLTVTLLINGKHGTPLWKLAPPPYLFHSSGDDWWDEDERHEPREGLLERKSDMDERAKAMGARLRRTGRVRRDL